MEGDGLKDGGRPSELAEKKPTESPPNPNPPQWRPERGPEELRKDHEHSRKHEELHPFNHHLGSNPPQWRPTGGTEALCVKTELSENCEPCPTEEVNIVRAGEELSEKLEFVNQ